MCGKEEMLSLAPETSCAETAAAVVKNGREVKSNNNTAPTAIYTSVVVGGNCSML